jgi:hypothetical protein
MIVKIGVTVMPVRDHGSVLNSQEQPLRVACTLQDYRERN